MDSVDDAHCRGRSKSCEKRIDLLFTDMIMPGGLNGKQLATRARAGRADLRVLFTSGFPGTANGLGAEFEPSDALPTKPYHKRELAKAVADALRLPVPA